MSEPGGVPTGGRFRSAWGDAPRPAPAPAQAPTAAPGARPEPALLREPLAEPARWKIRTAMVLTALAVLWVLWEGGRTFLADVASTQARQLVQQWAAHTLAPEAQAMASARQDLLDARHWTPDNPTLPELLGDLALATAQAPFTVGRADAAQQVPALLREAREAYLASLALRPSWPRAWASLAAVHYGLGDRAAYLAAWQRAQTLGPNEPDVQSMLLDLALLDWNQAPAGMQAWAMKLFEQSDPGRRTAINQRAQMFGLQFVDE